MKALMACLALFGFALMSSPTIEVAEANQCVSQCRNAHNRCRMATKGSRSCDGQLQSCLDGCRSQR